MFRIQQRFSVSLCISSAPVTLLIRRFFTRYMHSGVLLSTSPRHHGTPFCFFPHMAPMPNSSMVAHPSCSRTTAPSSLMQGAFITCTRHLHFPHARCFGARPLLPCTYPFSLHFLRRNSTYLYFHVRGALLSFLRTRHCSPFLVDEMASASFHSLRARSALNSSLRATAPSPLRVMRL
jgi:hypothetical protein